MAQAGTAWIPFQGDFSALQRDARRQGDRAGGVFASGFDKKSKTNILNGFKGIAGAAAGIFAGAQIVGFFSDFIEEGREAEKVGRITANVIEQTDGVAKITAGGVAALAEALSAKAGIDDEVIQTGANLLLTFKNIRNEAGAGNDIFNRSVEAATDLSVQFGSVDSASKMLGKALNDPLKGITALSRAGVTFTDQQKDQIATFVEQGDVLSAQKIILGEVESQVGGAAAAAADPMAKLDIVIGNLKETIGIAMLPVLESAATWLGENLPGALERAGDMFGWLRDHLKPVGDRLGEARDQVVLFYNALKTGFTEDEGTPIERIALFLRDTAIPVFGWFKDVIGAVVGFVRDNLTPILAGFAGALVVIFGPAVWGLISSAVGGLASALASPVVLIGALVAAAVYAYQSFEPFRDAVNNVASAIWDGLVAAFNWVTDTAIPAMIGAWDDLVAGFERQDVSGVFGTIGEGARILADDITGLVDTISSIDWAATWANITSGANSFWSQLDDPQALVKVIDNIDWGGVRTAIADGLTDAGGWAITEWAEEIWDGLWDTISGFEFGDGVWASFTDSVSGIAESLSEWFAPAIDTFEHVRDVIVEAAEPVGELVSTLGTALRPVLDVVWPVLQRWWTILKGVGIALGVVAYIAHRWFLVGVNAIATAVGWLTTNVLPAFTWYIEHVVTPVVGWLTDAFLWAFDAIGAYASWAWENVIQPVFGFLSDYVTNILIPGYEGLWDVVSSVFGWISDRISWAWGYISPIFGAIVGFIRDELMVRFELFKTAAGIVWEAVSGAVTTAWGVISPVFTSIRDGIGLVAGWIGDRVDDITGFFSGMADTISTVFRTVFNGIANLWNSTVGGFSFEVEEWVPLIGGKKFEIPPMDTIPEPRMFGGPVEAGRSYIVGERRPELFVPNVSGRIVPRVPDIAGAGASSIDYVRLAEAIAANPPVVILDGAPVSRSVGRRQGFDAARVGR